MSRRPKLIVGDLYHIKSYHEFDGGIYKDIYEEYLARAITVGEQKTFLDGATTTAIIIQCTVIASTKDDIPSSDLQYDYTTASYPWRKSWILEYPATRWRYMEHIVIQKFNPKKLPLYLNWGYGIEVIRGMLKGTYDKSGRPHTAEHSAAA